MTKPYEGPIGGKRRNAKTVLSDATETFLTNIITRGRIVVSFKDCPSKLLRRRPKEGKDR